MSPFELLRYYTKQQIYNAAQHRHPPDLIYKRQVISWLDFETRMSTVEDIKNYLQFFSTPALSKPLQNTIYRLCDNKLAVMFSLYNQAFGGSTVPMPTSILSTEEKNRLQDLTLRDLNRRGENFSMFHINKHCRETDFANIDEAIHYWQRCDIKNPIFCEYLSLYLNAEYLLAIGIETQTRFMEQGLVLVEGTASNEETTPLSYISQLMMFGSQQLGPWFYKTDTTNNHRTIHIISRDNKTLEINMINPYHKFLKINTGEIGALKPPFVISTQVVLQQSSNNEILLTSLQQCYFNQHMLPFGYYFSPLEGASDFQPLTFSSNHASNKSSRHDSCSSPPTPGHYTTAPQSPIK